eukprot:scaffold65200_cov16-Tisochrysis_lutea.AAC.2
MPAVEQAWFSVPGSFGNLLSNLHTLMAQTPLGAGSKAEREKDHRQRDEMCADRLKSAPVRVFALSDLHVDQGCNMDYIEEMHSQAFQNDVLIVAGDVADTFNATVHALKVLKSKFM